MTAWSGSILLSQGQSAVVRTLVEAHAGVQTVISVDQPPIHIVSVWEGETVQTDYVSGQNNITGFAVAIGADEISYLMNYVANVGALSTVTIDAQVKEASVSLAEG